MLLLSRPPHLLPAPYLALVIIKKARQNGENVNPFGKWPPWLATGADHGPDGSAPHQYR